MIAILQGLLISAFLIQMSVSQEPIGEKKRANVSKELQKKIDKAVKSGVEFLKKNPNNDVGRSLLSTFAILKGGVKKDDPLIQNKKKAIIGNIGSVSSGDYGIYTTGIAAMFLAEFDDKESKDALQKLADIIVSWHLSNGSWGYGGKGTVYHQYDNVSTAQYALLGLQAAANKKCSIPKEVFEKAAQYFLDVQEKPKSLTPSDRDVAGWGYAGANQSDNVYIKRWPTFSKPYSAMTSVGIASLEICKANLKGNIIIPRIERSIKMGINWVGKNFSVEKQVGIVEAYDGHAAVDEKSFLHYYLYSLERAGCFARIEKFGNHKWYEEGAKYLLKTQKADGSWVGEGKYGDDATLATSFAILFLARGSEGFIPTPR